MDRAWLNTAHQGHCQGRRPTAGRRAIEEKLDPRRIAEEAFFEIPARLRRTLGRLIAAGPAEIALGNTHAVRYIAAGGPNHVVSASVSPRSVPSPTQAT